MINYKLIFKSLNEYMSGGLKGNTFRETFHKTITTN